MPFHTYRDPKCRQSEGENVSLSACEGFHRAWHRFSLPAISSVKKTRRLATPISEYCNNEDEYNERFGLGYEFGEEWNGNQMKTLIVAVVRIIPIFEYQCFFYKHLRIFSNMKFTIDNTNRNIYAVFHGSKFWKSFSIQGKFSSQLQHLI